MSSIESLLNDDDSNTDAESHVNSQFHQTSTAASEASETRNVFASAINEARSRLVGSNLLANNYFTPTANQGLINVVWNHGAELSTQPPPIDSNSREISSTNASYQNNPFSDLNINKDQENVGSLGSFASARQIIKCPFQQCQRKVWLTGFNSNEGYQVHLTLHQCQWMVRRNEGRQHHACKYVPTSTEDAINHLEQHLENDTLPQLRATDGTNRLLYYCPYQTCMSAPYTEKGSSNRAHVFQHIRKHIGS